MAEAVIPRPASTILLLRDSAGTKGADDNGRGPTTTVAGRSRSS
jgi:hypothetical protein